MFSIPIEKHIAERKLRESINYSDWIFGIRTFAKAEYDFPEL